MKVYTLLETDTDTAGPSVAVFTDHEEATRVAKFDI